MHCSSESGSVHLLFIPNGFCYLLFEIYLDLMTDEENRGYILKSTASCIQKTQFSILLCLFVCFFLDFLVKFLEQEVCKLNWDVGFVTSTMQEIGVQLPRLLEVYDQLFKARVRERDRFSKKKKKIHRVLNSF